VHEVAQEIDPACRIVYVDHDRVVAVHTLALTASTPEGKVVFHPGDQREPAAILSADAVRATLDFSQPVAVLLFAVLHFVPDDDTATTAVRQLTDALTSGSYLALSHATFDPLPEQTRAALAAFTKPGAADDPFKPRTRDEVTSLLAGLELLEPGLVSTVHWRPDPPAQGEPSPGEQEVIAYAAVARKP
jgi:S-adenosyl methyltransferase